MNNSPEEHCIVCDDPTGRSGRGEDSLYCEYCDIGPFCPECFDEHMKECGGWLE